MVLLVIPTAVELSVWVGDLRCGQPISMILLHSGIVFLSVMYRVVISASDDDAITDLMICAKVKTGLLSFLFEFFLRERYGLLICYGLWIR